MASTKGLKPGDRRYNADTNEWEVKAKSVPVPKDRPKKSKKKKAPVPKDRPKKSVNAVRPEGKASGMPAAKKKAPVKGLNLPSNAKAAQANASKASELKGKVAEKKKGKGHGIAMGKYRLK